MLDNYHILVVDDDDRIRSLLSRFLKQEGYIVSTASNAEEARSLTNLFSLDLIILDLMMPGESGLDFAKSIRKQSNIVILMLTALGSTEDRISGLENGADDYLPKPFDPKELLLRIQKLLFRSKAYKKSLNTIQIGKALFNSLNNTLELDGKVSPLSVNETKLLKFFLARKSSIIPREEIAEYMGNINDRSVDVQVTRLRNKIESNPKSPVVIQSIRNKGYVFYA